MRRNVKNGVVYYTFENLEAAGMVRHAFSTRIGGVSTGHFAAMNLGLHTSDDVAAVQENYRRFCDAVGFDVNSIVVSDQYHTTNIVNIEQAPGNTDFFDARPFSHVDGFITNKPRVVLMTYFADCVSLLFCDPAKAVVANAHAGWRGTLSNMAGIMVDKMKGDYGCDPKDILVGIGPSISRKNFEVGPEVAEEFEKLLPFSRQFVYNSESAVDKYHIDLWEVNRQNLVNHGVLPDNIEIAGLCTHNDEAQFYSHRRSGKDRGSLAAFIELRRAN